MGVNVLHDLIEYTARIDAEALKGKPAANKAPPMNLAGLTKMGRMRG